MAYPTDWDEMTGTGQADQSVIRRGKSSAFTKPAGAAGSFVFGFNSLVATGGFAGYVTSVADFAPIAPGAGPTPESQGGGQITGCLKRGTGTAKTGFSPFLFIGCVNAAGAATKVAADARAYILGLEDASPSRIVLVKGPVANGAGAVNNPGTGSKVLRYSSASYDWDVWHQLRLDMIVNLGGSGSDVVLRAYRNDLTANNCNAPNFQPIAFNDALNPIMGAGCYIDDCLGINSGSVPYAEGYVGFGFKASAIGRRGFFDYLTIKRQNAIAP